MRRADWQARLDGLLSAAVYIAGGLAMLWALCWLLLWRLGALGGI
jgi:hypothetical protein